MKKPQKFIVEKGGAMLCFLIFFGAVFYPISAQNINLSETIYVDDDNTKGPWEGTIQHPYNSIQEAINNASTGDTVFVFIGIYNEKIVIDGPNKEGLSLIGEDKNFTLIDLKNEYDDYDVLTIRDTRNIEISGFTITGSGLSYNERQYIKHGINCINGNNILIKNNNINTNGNGINGDISSQLIIEYNNISNNLCDGIRGHSDFSINKNKINYNGFGNDPEGVHGDGISIWNNAQESTITYNEINYNRVDGIWDEGVDEHIIIGNEISYNGNAGIHFSEGRQCVIKNNVICYNGYGGEFHGYGINLYQSTLNTVENNTISNNKYGVYLYQSQVNEIYENIINDNSISGIYLQQTSSNKCLRNFISGNTIGITILMASGFNINRNDIILNKIFGLVAIVGIGSANQNYWGNIWGPYMGNMFRFIPPLPIVFPSSRTPNTDLGMSTIGVDENA